MTASRLLLEARRTRLRSFACFALFAVSRRNDSVRTALTAAAIVSGLAEGIKGDADVVATVSAANSIAGDGTAVA